MANHSCCVSLIEREEGEPHLEVTYGRLGRRGMINFAFPMDLLKNKPMDNKMSANRLPSIISVGILSGSTLWGIKPFRQLDPDPGAHFCFSAAIVAARLMCSSRGKQLVRRPSTGRDLIKSENSGDNAETTSRMSRGDKLPLIIMMISLWSLQRGISEVAGEVQPLTATTPPTSNNSSAPATGPKVPEVHAPSPISEVPKHSAPPTPSDLLTQSAAPKQSDPPTQEPAGQLAQFQQVLSSLCVNNYTTGAKYISDYLFLLPLDSTLFVPTNAAFNGLKKDGDDDHDAYLTSGPVLAYHAILQQLSYQQIALLPVGTRFATLLANNNTIEITSVAPDDLRVDDVRVVQRDICSSDTLAMQISCHGVDGILNMTEWGTPSVAPIASPRAPIASPALSPVLAPELAPLRALSPVVVSPSAIDSASTPVLA